MFSQTFSRQQSIPQAEMTESLPKFENLLSEKTFDEFPNENMLFIDKVDSDRLCQMSYRVNKALRLSYITEGFQNKFKHFEETYQMRTKDYMETYVLNQVVLFHKGRYHIDFLHRFYYGNSATRSNLVTLPAFEQVLMHYIRSCCSGAHQSRKANRSSFTHK